MVNPTCREMYYGAAGKTALPHKFTIGGEKKAACGLQSAKNKLTLYCTLRREQRKQKDRLKREGLY